MRRRAVLALLGWTAAWPRAACARPSKVWRIGMLETIDPMSNRVNLEAFRKGLREHGYVEGQNLLIEYRSAAGRSERFAALASELVSLPVDVIITRGTPAVLAAKNASSTIPIVMAASGEPSGVGVVAGLAHPGGNVTGSSSFNTELELKRLELLTEIAPGVTRIAALYNMSNPIFVTRWNMVSGLAHARGWRAQLLDVQTPDDLEPVFDTAVKAGVQAVMVGIDALLQARRRAVCDLAVKYRLPAIYPSKEFVDEGGLCSYGVSYPDLYFRAASFVDKIFKGAKPSDLPVEQPTKFELAINMKAAKAIGLALAPTLLAQADEVIE